MKKTTILPMLFVMILLSVNTNAQLVSYNGQNGEGPNAVNETPQEIIDRTINHKASDRLVPYAECSRELFQKVLSGPVGLVEKREMFAWINKVNNLERATAFNGNYTITTDAEAILFLNKHLILIDNDGKEHVFKGLDYNLNSAKTGQIKRGPYASKKEKEMWFALGNFTSGNIHPGGSAMCGNPFTAESGASSQVSPKPFGEKGINPPAQSKKPSPQAQAFFDQAAASAKIPANSGGAPVYVNNNFNYVEGASASIDRSGNSDARAVVPASTSSPSAIQAVPPPTPAPTPIYDWTPGPSTTTSTTRCGQQGYGYGSNATTMMNSNPYAAQEARDIHGIYQATSANAAGTWIGAVAQVTGVVLQGLGYNRSNTNVFPTTNNNYWHNGTTGGGQAWTGGYGTGTNTTTTTGQRWTGAYGQ